MKKINEMIDHVMLEEPASYRPYLGMSQIGNPDERMLWLNFRWCLPPNSFEPRVSRILDLGQQLEDIIDLERVFCEALSLALPDYPRAEGAELASAEFGPPGVTPLTDEAARPFSVLAGLKDKLH